MAQVISFSFIALDRFTDVSDKINDSIDTTQKKINSLSSKLEKSGRSFDKVGRGLTRKVSLPVAGLATAAVVTAAKFEKAMNAVAAVSQETEENMALLTKQAKDLGASTAFTAAEVASGQEEMARTGFKANEILASMADALNLAAAGQVGLGEAAKISSDIVRQFGFENEEISRVVDVMVKSFTSANVDVQSLGESFSKVGAIAQSVDADFEELAAAISFMGDVGLQGGIAGTGLLAVFRSLINPTDGATKALEGMGIKIKDEVTGALLPLPDILDKFANATEDMTSKILDSEGQLIDFDQAVLEIGKGTEGTQKLLEIFGSRGGVAMAVLSQRGGAALRDFTNDLKNAGGIAEQVAEKQLEGLSGQFVKLKSATEGLFIELIDQETLDMFTNFVKRVTELVQELSKASPALFKFIKTMAVILIVLGPFIKLLVKLLVGVGILAKLGVGGGSIGKLFKTLLKGGGIVGLVLSGLVLIIQHFDKIKGFFSKIGEKIENSAFGQSKIGQFFNRPITSASLSKSEQSSAGQIVNSPLQSTKEQAEINVNINDPGHNVKSVESMIKGVDLRVGRNMLPVGVGQ